MKDLLTRLLEQLRSASPAARGVLLGATGLMVLFTGVTTYRATTPHYVLFSSGLDEIRFAKVQGALAAEAVEFKFSQPPGPYSIWVDEGALQRATNAVALSPALTPETRGILTGSGMGDAFKDAKTRNAIFWKSQWQEMEKQLEALDFVRQAVVTTSIPSGSPLRKVEPTTVSVTLELAGTSELSRAQSETIATLVRFRFDVPRENVVISDQSGRALFDGSREVEVDPSGSFFEQKLRWEREHRDQVTEMLTRMFGEGRALVSLHSEWNLDATEKVTERIDPEEKAVVQETRNKTKSSGVPAIGGAAGSITNVPGLGADSEPPGDSASTEESTKTTLVSKEWGHVSSRTPVITRLSVALALDESVAASLTAEKRTRLDAAVQSAVGFDRSRGDTYESFSTRFASIARDAEGNPVEPEPPAAPELPDPLIELLLEHGTEAVAGLVFVLLLLRTLKSRRGAGARATAGASRTDAAAAVDPELLARAQIDELLRSDPRRVGEILSRWAAEDVVGARAGR